MIIWRSHHFVIRCFKTNWFGIYDEFFSLIPCPRKMTRQGSSLISIILHRLRAIPSLLVNAPVKSSQAVASQQQLMQKYVNYQVPLPNIEHDREKDKVLARHPTSSCYTNLLTSTIWEWEKQSRRKGEKRKESLM